VAKSFLERIQPSRQRWKLVEWPFPVDGERPKLKVRVLGQDDETAAYLATVDHFKGRKPKVEENSPAFAVREHAELVWRAYSDNDEPIADDVEELCKQPPQVIAELYATYSQHCRDVGADGLSSEQLEALVEELKKNSLTVRLSAFPSNWLIALTTTLASRLRDSMPVSEPG
jgi:hypothetical protein